MSAHEIVSVSIKYEIEGYEQIDKNHDGTAESPL